MAELSAPSMDPDSALGNIYRTIDKLRDGLNQFTKMQSVLSSSAENADHVRQDTHQNIQACCQKMLASTVAASVAHESLIRGVADSREKVSTDQEALLKARLKLDNLRHEKRALQQQIDSCREVKSELLDKLSIGLPIMNTESDESTATAHSAITAALNDELSKRKRMREVVESVVKETSAKRQKLSGEKAELRELPRAIAMLGPSIEPIRRLVATDQRRVRSRDDLVKIHKLPGPLYTLGRSAVAYQEVYGGLEISTSEQESSKETNPESENELYRLHPMQTTIDVLGEQDGPRLRIVFRYHVNLQIVSVTSVIVAEGEETPSYPTKELQMLYPMDFGELSPNPTNDFLENGTFEFDVTKAKGGRPYIWANLACGIPCLPRAGSAESAPKDPFVEWPSSAARFPAHLRFKDVVETLRKRLGSVVSLKQQIETLLLKKIPVPVSSTGALIEPESRIENVMKLPPLEIGSDESLFRSGTNGKHTEVWAILISRGDLKINCRIALEPDYPIGPPVFRLTPTTAIPNLTEKDILELEQCVNEYLPEGKMAEQRDLVLGLKVRALLGYIDNLVAVCESIDEGTVENSPGEIRGRTRSKRDAILGQGCPSDVTK